MDIPVAHLVSILHSAARSPVPNIQTRSSEELVFSSFVACCDTTSLEAPNLTLPTNLDFYAGLTPEQIAELKQLKAKIKAQRAAKANANTNANPQGAKQPQESETQTRSALSAERRANRPKEASKASLLYVQLEHEREMKRKSTAADRSKLEGRDRAAKNARTRVKEARLSARAKALERVTQYRVSKLIHMQPAVREEAQSNLDWMRKQAMNAPDGIIRMTTSEFLGRVHSSPRPYWTVATFTALTPGIAPCEQCKEFYHNAQVPIAKRNLDALKQQPGANRALEGDVALSEFPVFYVILEPHQTRELWAELQIRNVPYTIMYPPSHVSKPRDISDLRRFVSKIPYEMKLQPTAQLTQQTLGSLVSRSIGAELPHLQDPDGRGPGDKVPALPAVIALLVLAALGAGVFVFWDYVILLRQFTLPYCLLACGAFIYGTSGFQFNRLNGVPWSRGQHYISPSHNSQLGAEAVIVASVNAILASVMVALIVLVVPGKLPWKLTKNAEEALEPEGPSKPQTVGKASKFESLFDQVRAKLLSSTAAQLTMLGLFVYVWYQNLGLYTFKNRGYKYGFVW